MNQNVTLTLAECPAEIRAYFLGDPAYQSAIKIVKTSKHDSGTPSIVEKTLKTGIRHVQKAVNRPGFAEILEGSVSRDSGTPAPHRDIARVKPVQSIADSPPHTQPAVRRPTQQTFNTPKEPMRYERGNSVVEWKELQAEMAYTMRQIHSEEADRAFNEKRSAFSRLVSTKTRDVQGGGSGNVWALRNLGGQLAATLLNGTARKDEKPLPTNTGFRAVSGHSLRG